MKYTKYSHPVCHVDRIQEYSYTAVNIALYLHHGIIACAVNKLLWQMEKGAVSDGTTAPLLSVCH